MGISLHIVSLFTHLVGVISLAERIKIGIVLSCENTGASGMIDDMETSIDEILHGPEGKPLGQSRTIHIVS